MEENAAIIGPVPCRVIDVAIAVIERGGQVLVCQRRAGDVLGGLWEFPGGKREPDESIEQCLMRELQEELSVRIVLRSPFKAINYEYPSGLVRLYPYLCELADGEPRPIACQCLRWIDPPRLRDLPFPPANAALIEEVIERLTEK